MISYHSFSLSSDIDECSSNTSSCQQLCSNTAGSYVCNCRPGYQISSGACNGEAEYAVSSSLSTVFSSQILMNAQVSMIVSRFVQTLLDHTHVAVEMGLYYLKMATPAMVQCD